MGSCHTGERYLASLSFDPQTAATPGSRFYIKELTMTETKDNHLNSASTRSVHAGEQRNKPYHSLIDPIVPTSTYYFDSYEDICQFTQDKNNAQATERLEYGRYGNPTIRAVEHRLAALEAGEEALLFASGMAAVTTTLLTFLKAGDHIIFTDDIYRKTREFGQNFLNRFGVESTVVAVGNEDELESEILKNTRLILSESPTNPYLRVVDVEKLVEIARKHGLLTLIDATFATPINLRPLDYGIDLVLHSGTKYLGGHHDLLSGVVVGRKELVDSIREHVNLMGAVADPYNAYLLLRGLKTLALRVRHQNQAAMQLAEYLLAQPLVEQVYYPGLENHPDYAIAKRQMSGFGGVVSFTLRADLERTARFLDRLKIPYITPSLGGAESLVSQPALLSYYSISAEDRAAWGIKDNLVRYALGIEDVHDLITDLQQAFDWLQNQS
ncbi:MAG: PLP-dependent aspartate aminotransferase family protein [Anaerolineaceae bacterium]|nr:PLP-dependent aspartate aminotransferase family protein [Anaerolineaceae bacterium]